MSSTRSDRSLLIYAGRRRRVRCDKRMPCKRCTPRWRLQVCLVASHRLPGCVITGAIYKIV